MRIGSADDNELVLADPLVSRHHAVVEQANGRIVVRDLGSTNGTLVANVPVKEAFLAPGAKLRIGSATLELTLSARQESLPLSATRGTRPG